MISKRDVRLFNEIKSQTGPEDKKSLLLLQNFARKSKNPYVYLEIGSHLGGSIQPHLVDPKCIKIYSVDKRPIIQPDAFHKSGCEYPGNSTQRMLNNLEKVSKEGMLKIECFDCDASEIKPELISPKPDFCFIDGEHTNRAVVSDFTFCKSALNNDGIIAFHDSERTSDAINNIIAELKEEKIRFESHYIPNTIFFIKFGKFSISNRIMLAIHILKINFSKLDFLLGSIGIHVKKHFPKIYFLLKRHGK